MTSRIICIVPRLPPSIDGLGDCAVQIVRQLLKLGLSCTFIVADLAWVGHLALRAVPSFASQPNHPLRSPQSYVNLMRCHALYGYTMSPMPTPNVLVRIG
jgi:hypothetical protein